MRESALGLQWNEDLDEGLQPSSQELDRIANEGIFVMMNLIWASLDF